MPTFELTLNVLEILGSTIDVARGTNDGRERIAFLEKVHASQVVIVDQDSLLKIWAHHELPIITERYAKGRRMVIVSYPGRMELGPQQFSLLITNKCANLYPKKRTELQDVFEVTEFRGLYGGIAVVKFTNNSFNRLISIASNFDTCEGYVKIVSAKNIIPGKVTLKFVPTETNKFNIHLVE